MSHIQSCSYAVSYWKQLHLIQASNLDIKQFILNDHNNLLTWQGGQFHCPFDMKEDNLADDTGSVISI